MHYDQETQLLGKNTKSGFFLFFNIIILIADSQLVIFKHSDRMLTLQIIRYCSLYLLLYCIFIKNS